MSVHDEVLEANKSYAEGFGTRGELAMPPARQFAILTCLDARIDPAKLAGLSEGDAHVIRNAGGRASDDAMRSLVIRTSCSEPASGSSSITRIAAWSCSRTRSCAISSREPRDRVVRRKTVARPGNGSGLRHAQYIDFLTIADREQSVADDVERIRSTRSSREHPHLRLRLRRAHGPPRRRSAEATDGRPGVVALAVA